MPLEILLILCAASPVAPAITHPGHAPAHAVIGSEAVVVEQAPGGVEFEALPHVAPHEAMGPEFETYGMPYEVGPVPEMEMAPSAMLPRTYLPNRYSGYDYSLPPYAARPLGAWLRVFWPGTYLDPWTHKRCRAWWDLAPGDMYPHTPYFPVFHGDYYFRPYSWEQVYEQRAIACRWGASPMSPYAGGVFEAVYQDMGAPALESLEQVPPPAKESRKPSDHFERVNAK